MTEGAREKNMHHSTPEPAQKEWRRPSLRKLPIAATASGKSGGTTDSAHGKAQGQPDAGTIS
jgi:hypothetical protein